jgi:ABC-type amino acid transport substrate-binding protein
MREISADLGLRWKLVPYDGEDFNGIFAGLDDGAYDCVASGTTITPERREKALFCGHYLRSGQSLVANVERTPDIRSIDDLAGRIIGVQHGNTSEPVAHRLKAEGRVGAVKTYAYHDIGRMLDDVEAGRIAAVMKLAPVMRWFTRDRPALQVVQETITDEELGVCVALGNVALQQAIDASMARLRADGTLARLTDTWIGT